MNGNNFRTSYMCRFYYVNRVNLTIKFVGCAKKGNGYIDKYLHLRVYEANIAAMNVATK